MQQLLDGKTIDAVAIERLQEFHEQAQQMQPYGYWLAHSGGKDSIVIHDLAKRAGVKFEAHHSLTTADPPEVVWFIKSQPDIIIDKPEMSMWQLIRKKGMPPRRNARFCCESQKESRGQDCIIVTGVRWGESVRRSKRRMFEACYRKKRTYYLHPIIDWTSADVWEYIRERNLPYCSLYDEGFKRVGCVLCPMAHSVAQDMKRWPKLCKAWERAIKATYKPRNNGFESAEAYWQWWLDRDRLATNDVGQCMMFE